MTCAHETLQRLIMVYMVCNGYMVSPKYMYFYGICIYVLLSEIVGTSYLCVLYRPFSVIILVQILSEAPIANNSEVNIFRRTVMGLIKYPHGDEHKGLEWCNYREFLLGSAFADFLTKLFQAFFHTS